MSLRITAERVDRQLRDYMRAKRIAGPWKTGQRLIVGISESPHSGPISSAGLGELHSLRIRSWVAVHVETSKALDEERRRSLPRM